jgi:hypothetical protein
MMADLAGINTVQTEAIALAERQGWQVDGQDLCPNCVFIEEELTEEDD